MYIDIHVIFIMQNMIMETADRRVPRRFLRTLPRLLQLTAATSARRWRWTHWQQCALLKQFVPSTLLMKVV